MKKIGFAAGLCTGVMLLCGISAGAADLTAQLSQQPIYVEGERVWDVTAYDITTDRQNRRIDMKKIGFAAGLCTGVMLLCGISAGAADLTAQLSQQPIYVEGERVWDVTAYDINGNNYVKLRDMGLSVGFDVVYDASTDSVHIDPTIAYSGNPETYLDVEIPKTASAKLSQQPLHTVEIRKPISM